MSNTNIPEKTIERLSEYRRTLMNLHRQGITHIFSHVLAGMQGITAVQVRRDLMLIGFSSDTKKGYDVEVLIDFINGILDSSAPMNIAVIGMVKRAIQCPLFTCPPFWSYLGPQSFLAPLVSTEIAVCSCAHTCLTIPSCHQEIF